MKIIFVIKASQQANSDFSLQDKLYDCPSFNDIMLIFISWALLALAFVIKIRFSVKFKLKYWQGFPQLSYLRREPICVQVSKYLPKVFFGKKEIWSCVF